MTINEIATQIGISKQGVSSRIKILGIDIKPYLVQKRNFKVYDIPKEIASQIIDFKPVFEGLNTNKQESIADNQNRQSNNQNEPNNSLLLETLQRQVEALQEIVKKQQENIANQQLTINQLNTNLSQQQQLQAQLLLTLGTPQAKEETTSEDKPKKKHWWNK